jgi:hypothetical protein
MGFTCKHTSGGVRIILPPIEKPPPMLSRPVSSQLPIRPKMVLPPRPNTAMLAPLDRLKLRRKINKKSKLI